MLSSRNRDAASVLRLLTEIKEQKPVIVLFHCSFQAHVFPLWTHWDTLKNKWNRLAYRLSFERRVAEGIEGKGVYRSYHLPYFTVRSEKLHVFLSGLREAKQNNPGDSAN
jgi:hypothetical protein